MKLIEGKIYSNGFRWTAETNDGEVSVVTFATYYAAEHWLKMSYEISESAKNRKGRKGNGA